MTNTVWQPQAQLGDGPIVGPYKHVSAAKLQGSSWIQGKFCQDRHRKNGKIIYEKALRPMYLVALTIVVCVQQG